MNSIQEKFQELREDYSVANVIRYTDYLESCSKSDIVDCFENTFVEPIKGGEFTKKFILLNSFTENELDMMKASMESFVNNAETNLYDNYEHIEAVKECIQLIDAKLEHVTHISMVDLMLESMYLSEMEITCEGAQIADELLKKIISNDISDDVKTKYANKLIAKIKAGEVPLNTIKGANIIISTTAAIIYYATVIPLSVISLMLPIPVLMVSSAINKGLTKANYKICKRILESEIRKVEVAQSTNDISDTLMTYLQNLQQARELLMGQGNFTLESTLVELDEQETLSDKVKILDMAISENFIKFAFSEDETVEESTQWFNNIIALTNTKIVIVEGFVNESKSYDEFFDELEEELDEFEDELDFEEEEEYVEEGTKSDERRKKVNVAANKIKSKAQKVKDNIKKSGQASKAAVNHVKNTGKAVDDALTNTVNKAKDTYRNDIREEIVEDKTRVKLFRIVRKGIGIGVAVAVNPALGAITALVTYALSKKVKEKERRRILHELNEELEIVNEKIEDARGDSDKEKKYQLMRIRNQLKRDINRIQFRIKSDGKGV